MNHYQRLLKAVSDLQRQLANVTRVGVVKEVKGDKLRMVIGKNQDGEEVLSPWLNTNNHRGGARERRFYKKGQNLALISPSGDPRQGVLMPYAPNKDFLRPDHANKSGQDEETFQLDDLRVRKTKEGYSIWLQPPKQQQQQQGDQQKLPDPDSDKSGQAKMLLKISKDGGITGRVGKKMRFSAHEKGVKLKADKDFLVVVPGKIIASQELTMGQDPIPDDDEV